MFPETISPDTNRLIEKIKNRSWLNSYYLAGGTALALHLGHRTSIDLDFFSEPQKRAHSPLLVGAKRRSRSIGAAGSFNSGSPVMIDAENFKAVVAAKQSAYDMANLALISEAFIIVDKLFLYLV
ncbi:MAG: nucleotidyl transferase AbiEii/AbiGii toxin family protein [Bacteroidales bacterium]|nr:nucleotidyl transferase AbiEii/AbiGii toxin family protein [Bacteroidales bacterium]